MVLVLTVVPVGMAKVLLSICMLGLLGLGPDSVSIPEVPVRLVGQTLYPGRVMGWAIRTLAAIREALYDVS
jgi:hypothetical protein